MNEKHTIRKPLAWHRSTMINPIKKHIPDINGKNRTIGLYDSIPNV